MSGEFKLPEGLRVLSNYLEIEIENMELSRNDFRTRLGLWALKSLTEKANFDRKYRKHAKRKVAIDKDNSTFELKRNYDDSQTRLEVIAIFGALYLCNFDVTVGEIETTLSLPPFNSTEMKPRLSKEEIEFLNIGIEYWNKLYPDEQFERLTSSQKHWNTLQIIVSVSLLIFIFSVFAIIFFIASPPEAKITDPYITVESNSQWQIQFSDFDGVRMSLVPVGCFTMGRSNPDRDNESPPHERCISEPYWIDHAEATNEQFGSYSAIECDKGFGSSDNSYPRNCVNWFDAWLYCISRGGRLPTELEWEWAARGPDGNLFPWGNRSISGNAIVINGASVPGTYTSADGRSAGQSWVGAIDMSGNLWEWTSSLLMDYPYNAYDGRESFGLINLENGRLIFFNPVLRGGSWDNEVFKSTTTYRGNSNPFVQFNSFGVRCVRNYE